MSVELLVLGRADIAGLLSFTECIDVMRSALVGLAHGTGHQPLRSVIRPPDLPGFLGLMPGYAAGDQPALGIKFLGIFPGNPRLGKDAHQGVVVLLDPATGEPKAVLDASALTEVRTAAVSALATDVLARPDATVLAVFGTGVQGVAHAKAIAKVRPLTSVRLVGRDAARGKEAAVELGAALGVPVEWGNAESALDGAEIVVTATTSATPVLRRDWLAPGTHVNAVGACVPRDRELDTETVAASRFFVDRRESALHESGDLLLAGLGEDHIAGELGDVLAGNVPGRTSPTELTVFKSLGLAVEDLAAAAFVCAAAEREGLGTRVAF